MRWGQVIISFILGAFFGPWLLSMVTGKGKQSAGSY
jgi:hypothetical protein